MLFNDCRGNINFMYEWRENELSNEWFPCHLFDSDYDMSGYKCVYTKDGHLKDVKCHNVRKISKDDYIQRRAKDVEILGPYKLANGYHDTLERDLELWSEAIDI